MSIEKYRSYIASEFRAARAALRLRQDEVAEKAGCSTKTISRIESEDFDNLNYNTICEIANALGLTIKMVFQKKGKEERGIK